jgi:hypothetical protein
MTRAMTQALSAVLAPLLAFAPAFVAVPASAQVEIAPRVVPIGAAPAAMAAGIGSVLSAPSLTGSLGAISAAPLAASALSAPAAASVSARAAAAPASAAAPVAASAVAAPAAPAAAAPAAAPSAASAPAAAPAASAGPSASGRKRGAAPASRNAARDQLTDLAGAPGSFDGSSRSGAASAPAKYGLLGAKKSLQDPRNLRLEKYISSALPAAPASVNFSGKVKKWGMMLNDKIGDCTVAAAGHQIQQWTANAGKQKTVSDKAVLAVYEKVSGYRPGQPDTDGGADPLTVLKYWRKLGIGGHKIGAFAAVDYTNFDHIRTAVWLFGSAYLAIALPKSAQKQDVWDVPAGGARGAGKRGSWGGHAVEIAGFGPQGVLVVTWGQLKWMTWDFLKAYGEEAFAVISRDFLKNGKTPNNGLDLATLKADLKAVTAAPARGKPQ